MGAWRALGGRGSGGGAAGARRRSGGGTRPGRAAGLAVGACTASGVGRRTGVTAPRLVSKCVGHRAREPVAVHSRDDDLALLVDEEQRADHGRRERPAPPRPGSAPAVRCRAPAARRLAIGSGAAVLPAVLRLSLDASERRHVSRSRRRAPRGKIGAVPQTRPSPDHRSALRKSGVPQVPMRTAFQPGGAAPSRGAQRRAGRPARL